MNNKIILKVLTLLLISINVCQAGGCNKVCNGKYLSEPAKKTEAGAVDNILKQLNAKTSDIETFHCRIEYLFSQPLFESQSLRKGDLYYQKSEEKTKLRINFNTLKEDDDDEQKYVEQYIFDGVWLTHIDYPNKHVKLKQLAEPNEPADAFDLINENFPLIGFTKIEDLKKQFEIKLVEKPDMPKDFTQLRLTPKPDSIYIDDYTYIDFWVDKKIYLPAKLSAVLIEDANSPADSIYHIEFIQPKTNDTLDKKVFEFQIPTGFDEPERIPLKKKPTPK